jgi:cathepsin D
MGGLTFGSQTLCESSISVYRALLPLIHALLLVVTNTTLSGHLGTNASGIMGLAFSPVSKTNSVPFWQNLFNSNQLSQPLMSFWLTRYVNVTGARQYEYGGELTLGGTNASLYVGDIEYQNLASNPPDYWSLQLTGRSIHSLRSATMS